MGDWDVVTHWFDCPKQDDVSQVERIVTGWANDDCDWGLRYGLVSKTLVQVETTRKWGTGSFHECVDPSLIPLTMTSHSGHPEFPACQGHIVSAKKPGPFRFSWNYCVALGMYSQIDMPSDIGWTEKLDLGRLLELDELSGSLVQIAQRPAIQLTTAVPFAPAIDRNTAVVSQPSIPDRAIASEARI